MLHIIAHSLHSATGWCESAYSYTIKLSLLIVLMFAKQLKLRRRKAQKDAKWQDALRIVVYRRWADLAVIELVILQHMHKRLRLHPLQS